MQEAERSFVHSFKYHPICVLKAHVLACGVSISVRRTVCASDLLCSVLLVITGLNNCYEQPLSWLIVHSHTCSVTYWSRISSRCVGMTSFVTQGHANSAWRNFATVRASMADVPFVQWFWWLFLGLFQFRRHGAASSSGRIKFCGRCFSCRALLA